MMRNIPPKIMKEAIQSAGLNDSSCMVNEKKIPKIGAEENNNPVFTVPTFLSDNMNRTRDIPIESMPINRMMGMLERAINRSTLRDTAT